MRRTLAALLVVGLVVTACSAGESSDEQHFEASRATLDEIVALLDDPSQVGTEEEVAAARRSTTPSTPG